MRLHVRLVQLVVSTEPVLEVVARPEILELGLHHRAEVARRVVAELNDAAGIAFEDDHHSATDLGSWKRHKIGPENRAKC